MKESERGKKEAKEEKNGARHNHVQCFNCADLVQSMDVRGKNALEDEKVVESSEEGGKEERIYEQYVCTYVCMYERRVRFCMCSFVRSLRRRSQHTEYGTE